MDALARLIRANLATVRTVLIILGWLLASSSVLAGNRAWESTANEIYGNSSSSSLTDPSNDQQLSKRWLVLDQRNPAIELWDRGHIKVCFDEQHHPIGEKWIKTEDILRGRLEAARKLWRDFGLDDKDGWFRFEFMDRAFCDDRTRRSEYLLVEYAGLGNVEMATTVGRLFNPGSNVHWKKAGSRMFLSDSKRVGTGNVVSNFAHEMGHAWGLQHEHQNPRWWTSEYSKEMTTYPFFGQNWFCKDLADYQMAVNRVMEDPSFPNKDEGKAAICTHLTAATRVRFTGAMNWLPRYDAVGPLGRKEPDWRSIMIYHSRCGGSRPGSRAATVMLRNDGREIKRVFRPSQLDIDGLYELYGRERPKPHFLLQKTNRAFKRVYWKTSRLCSR
ncbi:hypothetical protein AJ79_08925 [Helicocarpus griseus UAMH5409]|uniref:Peptidase metallopeptidase domain-containing protein n=1 Tax=Helicocarpus griseus UAMH5409 TaxID=1447875 RepID=A0A2B7WNZ5_9EURO|nr:hypothetical protein AJ79_08925 [Helicocarpus griseus UAMH5409]